MSTTGLGDTLWATPALKALKNAYPDSQINLLTSPIGAQVLKNNPHIDQSFSIKNPILPHLFSIRRFIKKANPDTIFIFHASQRLILPLCAMSRASLIIGTHGINKNLDHLLTTALPKKYEHEVERRLAQTASMGAQSNDKKLEWHTSPKEKLKALAFLSNFDKSKPLFILHPGAKDRFKQWPPSQFIELGKKLSAELGAQILISGNAAEKELCETIKNEIPGARSIAGNLSLRDFAAVLPFASCFITNDTGPMHIAFATNTPTVALFGPTDPNLCGPLPSCKAVVIAKKRTCRPCLRKKCQDPFCMRAIGVDEVFANVKRFYINHNQLYRNGFKTHG